MKSLKKLFYGFLLMQSTFLSARTIKVTTDLPDSFGQILFQIHYQGKSGKSGSTGQSCHPGFFLLKPKDSKEINAYGCLVSFYEATICNQCKMRDPERYKVPGVMPYRISANERATLHFPKVKEGSNTPGHIHIYSTPDNFLALEEDGKILRKVAAARSNFELSIDNRTPYKASIEVVVKDDNRYKKSVRSGQNLFMNLPLKHEIVQKSKVDLGKVRSMESFFTTKVKVHYSDGSKGVLTLPMHKVTHEDAFTLKRRLIWGPRSAKNGKQWVAAIAPGTGSESSFNVGHAFGATANGPNVGAQMVATQVNIKNNFDQKVNVELVYQGGFVYPVMLLESGAQRNETIYVEQQHAKTVTFKVTSDGKEYVVNNIIDYIRADKAQQIELYKKGDSLGIKVGGKELLSEQEEMELFFMH